MLEVRRSVGKERSESCSDTVGAFARSDERAPDSLGVFDLLTLPPPTGDVVLYLHDPRRRNRQAAHGSRFKVKFVRPPKGKCAASRTKLGFQN